MSSRARCCSLGKNKFLDVIIDDDEEEVEMEEEEEDVGVVVVVVPKRGCLEKVERVLQSSRTTSGAGRLEVAVALRCILVPGVNGGEA